MNLFLARDPRPVHFVGIAGAGMSALAMLALRRGVAVTGSDRHPEGAPDLPRQGAVVREGHDRAYVDGARAVVYSAAIPADHVELARARELGIPVVPRKTALGELVAGRTTVAVAGTHGKTTTTVMAAEALAAAGLDPTALAGGRVAAWGGNARVGGEALYVVEADEYDQAFLALSPTVAVVTNVEPEHLECYDGSEAKLFDAFVTFADRARTAIVTSGDPGADRVAARLSTTVWRVGPGADGVALGPVQAVGAGSECRVRLPGGREVTLRLSVPGEHNVRNAAAALAAVAALDGEIDPALEALRRFPGVGRRFERLGERAGVAVVDDYAHHPTEIAATLAAARQAFPGRRLVAVFQPHLFSRTAVHAAGMGAALAAADQCWVTEVYAAREAPIPGVSGELVAEAARAGGAATEFEPSLDRLVERVARAVRSGDVVVTLGAGDVTTVGPRLLTRLGTA